MARREKRLKRLKGSKPKDKFASRLASRAFSGPINAKRYGFTASKLKKSDTCVFYSRFAAKAFLLALIGEDEITWKSDNRLITSRKVRIRGDGLKALFGYQLTTKQRTRFTLPHSYVIRAAYIRSDLPYRETQVTTLTTKKRHSRKGMVLIKTLAAEFGLHPRDARAILRASKVKKPEHGWAWKTGEDVERIRNLLKKG